MSLFFICYDLAKADENEYSDLFEVLEAMGAIRVQKSVWVVKAEKSASEIFEKLKSYFPDDQDRLLIGNVDGWSSRHSMNKIKNL
ncbi:MAG TPA: CRISPR-associated endonuclease Cas2 [bacterium]|nr:CRISPR-associated endonuclease Cas2 [bacterium]